MWNEEDIKFMRRAIALSLRGRGRVNPNPMVGAVIARDGEVLAEGWHKVYGGLHAETDALSSCTGDPSGATMYVTLEPCCHQGKQPPCTDAIIRAGIAKVVVGMTDPNPLVAGKGLKILREHGIEVVHGLLEPDNAIHVTDTQRLCHNQTMFQPNSFAQHENQQRSRRHESQSADLNERNNYNLSKSTPLAPGIKQNQSRYAGCGGCSEQSR